MTTKNNYRKDHDPTLYKQLLEEEGDLMFQDEEDQAIGADVKKSILGNKTVRVSKATAGCCSFSCLCKCALITLAVFIVLGLFATGAAFFWMKDVVEHLTVTDPHEPFPVVEMTDAELDVVKDRVKLFVDQLRAGHDGSHHKGPFHDLVITQDEINGFIGHCDYLRGNMQVTIEDGKFTEEYSLPVDMLPGGHGRFYVGEDYFKFVDVDGEPRVEFEMETAATHEDWFQGPLLFAQLQYLVNNKDGGMHLLELYVKKGSFFGNVIPQDFIDQHINVLDDFNNDPDNHDAVLVVDGIERISIEDRKIIVHPRNTHSNEEEVTAEDKEEKPSAADVPQQKAPVEEKKETLIKTTTTQTSNTNASTASASNLRKKNASSSDDVESYTFAKKIDGNVGAHSMPHHNHHHHNHDHDNHHVEHRHHHHHKHMRNKKSSSSSGSNSSSSSSDE